MELDKISIIIPVYNAEKFLNETIKSVLRQTYNNWELILVNDCSTDGSKKIYSKYSNDKRITWVNNKKNSGPAISRNNGIDKATGRYICFLDADDIWDDDKLEKQIKFMQDMNIAFSFHSYEFADENCIPSGKKVIAKEKLSYKEALKNNIISTITVMFDIKKIDKELIKMPNLKYVEDTATWWKVLRNNYVAYGMPNVFSYYRRTKKTQSSNKIITQKSLWNLYRKEEKLNIFYSVYCLFFKNLNAILRRI